MGVVITVGMKGVTVFLFLEGTKFAYAKQG